MPPRIKIFRDPVGQKAPENPVDDKLGPIDEKSDANESDNLTTVKEQDDKKISWEFSKENIQPISQGRKFDVLISALTLVTKTKSRQEMVEERRSQFQKDLESCLDDLSKQLDLWVEYIDWLEQNIPDGGKVNGITNAIETCIETFYDKNKFKQDGRLFNIFMKFKRFCDEPIEVFHFMYANSICHLLAQLYIDWSWQHEVKRNMMRAIDLINLGINNLASPREILLEARDQLTRRINRLINEGDLDPDDINPTSATNSRRAQNDLSNSGIRAALQTLKFSVSKNGTASVPINRVEAAVLGGMGTSNNNIGGLKSQTKVVNGVRVAANGKSRSTKSTSRAGAGASTSSSTSSASSNARNRGVQIYSENQENVGAGLQQLMRKVPTSQRIQFVGRTGQEN